ncbi:MAG: hypothetical protein NVS1B13_16540 [Flavisolibacter sp.]
MVNNGKEILIGKLFDLSGKEIKKQRIFPETTTMSVNELPIGSYIVQVQQSGGLYSRVIIKQ